MPFYFRFDCADYMREPSDIAVGGREFYVCDFKVMSLTIAQSSTSFLNFIMFFNIITLAGPQCCCFHRGRSLRKTNWVRIDSKMSASEKTFHFYYQKWQILNLRIARCESITNFPNGIDISDAGDILIGDSHGNR